MTLPKNLTLPAAPNRRKTAFTPADVSAGAKVAWWKFDPSCAFKDAGVTPAGNGDSIFRLASVWGGGWNLEQATTPGGIPVLNLTAGVWSGIFGGAAAIGVARPGGGTIPNPFVEYTVAKYTGTSGGNMSLCDGQNQNEFRIYSADGINYNYFAGSAIGSRVGALGTTYTFRKAAYDTPNGVSLSLNGGAAVTGTRTPVVNGISLGGNTNDVQRLVGVMYETVILHDPTPAEDAGVLGYLRSKFHHY